MMLGLATSMVFNGVQLGAHMVSQQMGLSIASTYDPMFQDQTTVIEQLGFWLTLVVFFALIRRREGTDQCLGLQLSNRADGPQPRTGPDAGKVPWRDCRRRITWQFG